MKASSGSVSIYPVMEIKISFSPVINKWYSKLPQLKFYLMADEVRLKWKKQTKWTRFF